MGNWGVREKRERGRAREKWRIRRNGASERGRGDMRGEEMRWGWGMSLFCIYVLRTDKQLSMYRKPPLWVLLGECDCPRRLLWVLLGEFGGSLEGTKVCTCKERKKVKVAPQFSNERTRGTNFRRSTVVLGEDEVICAE